MAGGGEETAGVVFKRFACAVCVGVVALDDMLSFCFNAASSLRRSLTCFSSSCIRCEISDGAGSIAAGSFWPLHSGAGTNAMQKPNTVRITQEARFILTAHFPPWASRSFHIRLHDLVTSERTLHVALCESPIHNSSHVHHKYFENLNLWRR